MIFTSLALLLGIIAGLIGMLPGLHPSVLLVGLLPLLGLGGDAGALALAGALGSGLASATLAKTFHPASPESLKSATPEQVMAYRGEGLKAVLSQLSGQWIGIFTTLLVVVPLLLLASADPHSLGTIYKHQIKPMVPLVVIAFLCWTVISSKKKIATILTLMAASTLGFYAFHSTTFEGSDALAPLLGGLFSVPMLWMIMSHKGKSLVFPTQRKSKAIYPNKLTVVGGFLGMLTALCAGLGSSAAVSGLAGKVKETHYLSMQAASESSNHLFALMLLVTVGISRSGVAATIAKNTQLQLTPILGGLLLLGVLGGLAFGHQVVLKITPFYITLVTKINPKAIALIVFSTTLILAIWHTGLPGLLLLVTAGFLGLAAKLNFAPNQALVAVLSGPSLIYAIGLAGPFATLLALR